MERLMTVAEVADYLRLNREVVLRKARKGEIPAVKVGTKTYRFYKGQLDKWLESKSTIKGKFGAPSYSLGTKGHLGRGDFSSVVASDKEQQLAVLAEARKLQAKIERRVGKPLPNSAEEIRALREERVRRAS